MQKTEMRNEKTTHIDRMSAKEMVRLMQDENLNAVASLEDALPEIADAIDAVSEAFSKGGRLFYLGAGTSGRLGVLDASECPPTFGVPATQVVGVIAGGESALVRASENAEDRPENACEDLAKHTLKNTDVVVGISASGGAAYVLGGLKYAKETGCVTVGVTSNAESLLAKNADIAIVTDTGAEVITGSTRMKAGTAQKLVLNMISTGAMVKSGYVYENLMINLKPSNKKLKDRMVRIVCELLPVSYEEAEDLLEKSHWQIREAIELATKQEVL